MATYYVDTAADVVADDAHTSLREALILAASIAGTDTIRFHGSLTIALTDTLVIDSDVNIAGEGDTTISGSGSHLVIGVAAGVTATMSDLTLTQGHMISGPGETAVSAVLNFGHLSMSNVRVTNMYAKGGEGPAGQGGGGAAAIFNSEGATLTMINGYLSGISLLGGGGGAGANGSVANQPGGAGGDGGPAAVIAQVSSVANSLTLLGQQSFYASSVVSGAGGNGGAGGEFAPGGNGGDGGDAAFLFVLTNAAVQKLYLSGGGYVADNGGFGGSAGINGFVPGQSGAAGTGDGIVTAAGASVVRLVTSLDDSGDGTLREILDWAFAGDVIKFDAALAGGVLILDSELVLSRDVTINGDIDGDGKADIIISGDTDGSDTNNTGDVRIFNITGSGTEVTLRSLTLTGGRADGTVDGNNGGAIKAALGTSLTLVNSTVSNSTATNGGGIHALGTFNSAGSTISSNTASFFGGGVYAGGAGVFVNTTITSNSALFGGGIDTASGSRLQINASTISGNSSGSNGGGINLYGGAEAVIYNSIVSGNTGAGLVDISKTTPEAGYFTGLLIGSYSVFGTTVDVDGGTAYSNFYNNNPMLGALAPNGGPVMTMRPLAGSPAIGGGGSSASLPADTFDVDGDGDTDERLPVDARGLARLFGAVDIGAVEAHGPVITSNGGDTVGFVDVAENSTAVTTVTATDIDGPALTYSISGGLNADAFNIDPATGVLTFKTAPDFEVPSDTPDRDGLFAVNVTVSDGTLTDTVIMNVYVTDVLGNTVNGTSSGERIDRANGIGLLGATNEQDTIDGKGGNDTIKGAAGADTIKGGKGDDSLKGDSGDDLLRGGAGKDIIDGGSGTRDVADFSDMSKGVVLALKANKFATSTVDGKAADKVKNVEGAIGGKAADRLTGDDKANLLSGNNGNDTLIGGKGIDTLIGGNGKDSLTGGDAFDWFLFNSALGSSNVDKVTDFKHDTDKIALDEDIFAAIGSSLSNDEFYARAGATRARDAEDRIIYNKTNGNLYYDADGTGTAKSAILFATLTNKPQSLDAGDFLIV
jgi:Ca2+-binding RTX toxin-like protein